MPLSDANIREALNDVQDPELYGSITEFAMVRTVRIDNGTVSITVARPTTEIAAGEMIAEQIHAALSPLDGVERIEVKMADMDSSELGALRDQLRGGRVGDAEPQRVIPFADADSGTRVLGITSGKGGVGKSSVTVNLAIALSKLGKRVAILDADVYGFSIPKMLGISQEPSVIKDVIVPPLGHGIRCISIGFFTEEDQPIMWRGPMLHKALEQFLVDVYWGNPDYLLIDMPPGTGDVALSMAKYLPRSEVFVVTTPQVAAQRVAQRTAFMAKKLNLPLFGVIENMSWFTGDDGKRYEIFGAGGGEDLANQLGVPLMGRVPLIPELRMGGDVGVPVTVSDPDSEASLTFDEIARKVMSTAGRRVYRSELTVS